MENELTMGRTDVVTVTLNPAIDQTLNIPRFTVGEVNRVEAVSAVAGGKGVNVASVLADAGHRVQATGFLGRENATIFETLFARKGIEDHFIRLDGSTRTGIKIVDSTANQTTDINFPGLSPTTNDIAALEEKLVSLESKWVVLAGSLPPQTPNTLYRDLAVQMKRCGCKVALDTSGDALGAALDAQPNLIKPNIHELEELVKQELPDLKSVIEAARILVQRGIETVVVSMGAEGACCVTADCTVIARPPSAEVKSTVGAGDAMVAGFISADLQSLSLLEGARLATAFSLDALNRLEAGLNETTYIRQLMNTVEVNEWR